MIHSFRVFALECLVLAVEVLGVCFRVDIFENMFLLSVLHTRVWRLVWGVACMVHNAEDL